MKKGFIIIYILPIFLLIIVLSTDILKSVTSTYKLTNNYFGKEKARAICDIGLKHGEKISREELASKEYYINLVNNKLEVSDRINGEDYTRVEILVSKGEEITNVSIRSLGKFNRFSHNDDFSYSINL